MAGPYRVIDPAFTGSLLLTDQYILQAIGIPVIITPYIIIWDAYTWEKTRHLTQSEHHRPPNDTLHRHHQHHNPLPLNPTPEHHPTTPINPFAASKYIREETPLSGGAESLHQQRYHVDDDDDDDGVRCDSPRAFFG